MQRPLSALVELGLSLRAAGYSFVTPTPATHAIVNSRADNEIGRSLTDIFGWSRPFYRGGVSPDLLALLEHADALEMHDGFLKSRVRFASLGDLLLVHSAFPTIERESVFFGPDTYRFARLLNGVTVSGRVVEIGCGTGAGGLLVGRKADVELILTDINERALAYTQVNVVLNGKPNAQIFYSDILVDVEGPLDLVIANPPYLCDGPTYRNGGTLGIDIALRIVNQSLAKLRPNGRLILYTGTPVVAGADAFRAAVLPMLGDNPFTYDEIDPDLFGDELQKAPYAHTDRIAAVALSVTKRT